MDKQVITKEITMNVPASQVWRMFVDASFTKQMGGEYSSDWQPGSMLRWKANGQVITNGRILQIEKERLLQHSLFYPDELDTAMAIITYRLREEDGKTALTIIEEFTDPVTENELKDSEEGWEAALETVRGLLER
jgi:uncharacterized protein YndB with AHSA1/START domain